MQQEIEISEVDTRAGEPYDLFQVGRKAYLFFSADRRVFEVTGHDRRSHRIRARELPPGNVPLNVRKYIERAF